MKYPIEEIDLDRGPEVVWDVNWYDHKYCVERADASGQCEGQNNDSDLYLFYIDNRLVNSKKVAEYGDEWEAIESLMKSSPEWIPKKKLRDDKKEEIK